MQRLFIQPENCFDKNRSLAFHPRKFKKNLVSQCEFEILDEMTGPEDIEKSQSSILDELMSDSDKTDLMDESSDRMSHSSDRTEILDEMSDSDRTEIKSPPPVYATPEEIKYLEYIEYPFEQETG